MFYSLLLRTWLMKKEIAESTIDILIDDFNESMYEYKILYNAKIKNGAWHNNMECERTTAIVGPCPIKIGMALGITMAAGFGGDLEFKRQEFKGKDNKLQHVIY